MDNTPQKVFLEKIKTICTENPESPLFVRLAASQLAEGEYQEAFRLLAGGLKRYPAYPTAYFLLGETLADLGYYAKAVAAFRKGSFLIRSPETFQHYVDRIEEKRKKSPEANAGLAVDEVDSMLDKGDSPGGADYGEEYKDAIDNQLLRIAGKLADQDISDQLPDLSLPELGTSPAGGSRVMPSYDIDFDMPEPEGEPETMGQDEQPAEQPKASEVKGTGKKMLASETLAEIYRSQGQFHEAIKIYQALAQNDPGKKLYFEQKIYELQVKLGLT